MSSSKNIDDYFEVEFGSLVPDRELSFDICIYFKRNKHLVTLRRSGDAPSAEFIDKYSKKGVQGIWISKDSKSAYEAYLSGPIQEAPESVSAEVSLPAPAEPQAIEVAPIKTAQTFSLPEPAPVPVNISPEQKSEMILSSAQTMMAAAFATSNLEKQVQMDAKVRATVKDILDSTADSTREMISELWAVSEEDDTLNHGINVGAYAVLLSMAFGKIENDLLADIALSGILHDVGISRISRWAIPEQLSNLEQMTKPYKKHVEYGLDIVQKFGAGMGSRVETLVNQHHEKFDGSGYPQSLQGFKVDDVAQLLAMANLLEELSSGQWDGKKRTRKQAIEEIERLEKTRTHPQFFNPDVLSAVLKWIKSESGNDAGARALEVVQSQLRGLLKAG